ncbi:MAG: hypothetical protein ABI806_15875 [Candidatus Solibacter sp.]
MGPKKTVEHEGRKVMAQPLEFDTKSEAWNQYALEDGSTLKMKIVLLNVLRLEGVYKDGLPVYQFAAHQILGVDVPDELKEK